MEYGKKISVGGFAYLKFKRDEMSFIKVSTLMGGWSMEWREDMLMYHILDGDISDEERKGINVAIVNAFMCGTILDSDFQHSVMVAAGELQERMNKGAESVSEEEDQEILRQCRTEAELFEEVGAELLRSEMDLPLPEATEAKEAWSVKSGEEFEFKNE